MFGEIGLDKLLLLLVMFLLLFGAKRIPEIGRSLGKGIREFKGSLAGLEDDVTALRGRDAEIPADRALEAPARAIEPVRRLSS